MGRNFRLTKNDDADIGLMKSALVSGIISFDEAKEWIYYVISESESVDDIPSYVYEILDAKEKDLFTLRTHELIGFTTGAGLKDSEYNALSGIGYKRFPNYRSDAVGRAAALRALEKNPHIEKLFRETFPFIDF